jgi:hypothetical protein
MSRFRISHVALWLAILLTPGVAARDPADPYWEHRSGADRGEFDYDDSGDVPWREFGAEIPSLPDSDEFLPLKLDSLPPGMVAQLHVPTVSVGKRDRVVRYWVLLSGQGGGLNATFEGLKCNTGEFKVYAYGHPKRQQKVRAAPNPKWRKIKDSNYAYRGELARDYLCAGITPRTLAQIELEVRNTSGYEDPLKQFHH